MGKEGTFFAAYTAADLHDDTLFVIGILGQQQDLQLGVEVFLCLLRGNIGLLAQLLHLRIGHQFFRILHLLFRVSVSVVGIYDGLQVAALP